MRIWRRCRRRSPYSSSKRLLELRNSYSVSLEVSRSPSIAGLTSSVVALAHVPYIVTEDWQTESRKKGKLLGSSFSLSSRPDRSRLRSIDPKDYQLVDREGEKKFGIVLQDVLARARAGKVFEGCTFHLTPHLALGREILKRIIEAHGGVVRLLPPLSPLSRIETE